MTMTCLRADDVRTIVGQGTIAVGLLGSLPARKYEKPSIIKAGAFRKTTTGFARFFGDQLVGRFNF
jgi:Family of unknown function (DUF5972)